MPALFAEHPAKPPITLAVKGVRFHDGKGQILVTAEGVNDRDAAESLRGRAITVAPEERVELPDGEYWIDSLIGLDVIESASGERLGKIEEVMNTGSNDVYMVRASGGELKLIPAIADVVEEISLERGEMRVNLPEGLWD
jgi:16S rRNA processing protein RimM